MYYLNTEFAEYLIIIFLIKIIKLKSLKNFNLLLVELNSNKKDLDFLIIFLNNELNLINTNKNYKSEFFLKLNITINSLFFLIFINNQSNLKDFLELNIFSTFAIKNLNFFLKNLIKELFINKKEMHKIWYIIINIKKIKSILNLEQNDVLSLEQQNLEYNNIFFRMYFSNNKFEDLIKIIFTYSNNINTIINGTQKFKRKNKQKKNKSIQNDFEKKDDELKNLDSFLDNFFSKKYNIFLKNKCSEQLTYLIDISYFLIKIKLFYESKLIVEFGNKYWSNSALSLSLIIKNLYKIVLINTKLLNLETDFEKENNFLIKSFFKNKKFYIKKNWYNEQNSIFDFEKIKIINNKLNKSVYYIDICIFTELYSFFENFFKKIKFNNNIKTLKNCIIYFETNIEKINNFNFFNIESSFLEEEEKYKFFFDIFNIFLSTYINYIKTNILNNIFLTFFFKNNDLNEVISFINNELKNIENLLNKNMDFESLNFLLKTIKNINLILNNTLEVNTKDVRNNKYNSEYFIQIEYCEYIIFFKKLKILISYLEQIITIYNLKQKLLEKNINEKKLHGIEIKFDFRGRLYSLDVLKAYDNNKLLRQSIKIKNTIKVTKLLNWYKNLYKKINLDISYFLTKNYYKYLLEKKEFKKYLYLFKLSWNNITKKDFIQLLYLKSLSASLIYLGFLLLDPEEKKTYSIINSLKKGYEYYYNNTSNININDLKLNIENYVEFKQTIENLNYLIKNFSFETMLKKNKLISLDSSCNGYTHLLFTFSEFEKDSFEKFKKLLNLTKDNINYDFYSEVLNEIKNKDSFLKEYIEKKIINRNSIKKIVMTIPYNAKEFSFREKLKNEILEKNKNEKEKIIKNLISFFSKEFKNKIINKSFTLKLKNFLKKNKIKNLWYVIDDNTKINITYYKEKNEKIPYIDNILNKKNSIYIKTLTTELNIEKTVIACIANIIHANDAYVIKEVIIQNILNVLTIHDCIKFNIFLFEEIIFLYEIIFKNFYKNYNIYDKLYYDTFEDDKLKKVFNTENCLNNNKDSNFENSQYILKL